MRIYLSHLKNKKWDLKKTKTLKIVTGQKTKYRKNQISSRKDIKESKKD